MIYTLFCSCRKTRPFRINRLGTLCAGAKTSNPLFSVHCALFCKTGGWVPNTSAPSFAPAVICTTWRLYPLWPHSVAHTSRHHGGVLPPPKTKLLVPQGFDGIQFCGLHGRQPTA